MSTKKKVPLEKDFDLDVDSLRVRVEYNYSYTHKNRKIDIFRGEVLRIITKNANNNEHWVKVLRPNQARSFYVPRLYVSVIDDDVDDDDEDHDRLKGDEEDEEERNDGLSTDEGSLRVDKNEEIRSRERSQEPGDGDEPEEYENNQVVIQNSYYDNHREEEQEEEYEDEEHRRQEQEEKEHLERMGQNQNERLQQHQQQDPNYHHHHPNNHNMTSLIENDGERIRIRTSMNLTTEIDIDENNQSFSSIPSAIIHEIGGREMEDHILRHKFQVQNEGLLGRSHNSSIEGKGSLSKGGTYWSESLEELSQQIVFPGQKSNLCFNNPGFASNSNCSNISKSDSSIKQRSHEENLDSTTEDTEDTIPKPENLIRNLNPQWGEYRNNSGRIFYYNYLTKSVRWKPPRFSKGECCIPVANAKEEENKNENNNVLVFNVPEAWLQTLDSNGAVAFINKKSGEKWFTSTDPNGKIYFYPSETPEGTEAKSSWFLPEDGGSEQASSSAASSSSHQQPQHHESISSGESSEIEDLKFVKRQCSSDQLDRSFKSRSLHFPEPPRKNDEAHKNRSLERPSIWTSDSHGTDIIYENLLNRTKLTENGKKVRKNWATSWTVLTCTHLTFFKDSKALQTLPIKSDMELDLQRSRIDWTKDKSSRKNVFEINSPTLHLLCQSNSQTEAETWFSHISSVIENLKTEEEDITFRLKANSPPQNSSSYSEVYDGDSTYKRRSVAKTSTKIKITSAENNDKNQIRSQLKKFFHRRPMRDSLIKKGIYKDEPVFGCNSLEKLTQLEGTSIPKFVTFCIGVIEDNPENMKTDGIYRASGNLSQVQKIRLQVDQDNLAILEQEDDVHVLAGSLKLFFREMREPVLPSNLFDRFLKACDSTPREAKIKEFKKLVEQLPKPNYDTLKFLLQHLLKVASYSEFNRMQINNLSIVFGPTLMWSNAESNINMATSLMRQNYVIESLLSDFSLIFP